MNPGGPHVPEQIAEPVRALLADACVTVTRGDNTLEFWWAKELPRKAGASGAPAWAGIADGAIAGALRIAAPLTDIRGLLDQAGRVHAALRAPAAGRRSHGRLALPRVPARGAGGRRCRPPTRWATRVRCRWRRRPSGKSHPASLSLDPPAATAEPNTVVTNDAGHKAVVFRVPVAGGGSLTFGLILVGTIQHQM